MYQKIHKTSNLLTCFRNERKCGAFNGVINTFSLDTEGLIQKYKDVELQLIFLKTEVRYKNNAILFISPLSSCLSRESIHLNTVYSLHCCLNYTEFDTEMKQCRGIRTVILVSALFMGTDGRINMQTWQRKALPQWESNQRPSCCEATVIAD